MGQHYRKADYITALVLAILMLATGFFSLDYGCRFGDDYAAYINEGIAIAEGRFKEQAHLNFIMHPTGSTVDAFSARVYVWGYPLLLSAVYRIVGFDRELFDSIICYKLPSTIALALFTVCFFLFLRRRFSYTLSLVLSVFTSCAGCEFYLFINNLYSDLFFLSFEMATFLIAEIRNSSGKRCFFLTVLLGILLWYTYEIRSAGLFVTMTILLIQVVFCLKKRRSRLEILFDYCPFIIAFLLILISERFIFAHASSEISELGSNIAGCILNVKKYCYVVMEWFSTFFLFAYIRSQNLSLGATTVIFLILAFLGIRNRNLKNDSLYLFFTVFYFLGTCLMSYYQGLRYLYPILPFVVLVLGYGIQKILELINWKRDKSKRNLHIITGIITSVILLLAVLPVIRMNVSNVKKERIPENAEAYSEDAKDIYRYIIRNTKETDIIAFYTARSLYLNTKRLTVPNEIIYSTKDVDWYLESEELNYNLSEKYKLYFEKIYENDRYALWRNTKSIGEEK